MQRCRAVAIAFEQPTLPLFDKPFVVPELRLLAHSSSDLPPPEFACVAQPGRGIWSGMTNRAHTVCLWWRSA